jgi:predicted AlkP superfamily pyrophosphatase or phosphodiesterase
MHDTVQQHRRQVRFFVLVPAFCVAVAAAGCGAPRYLRSEPIDPTRIAVPQNGVTSNVVLVSIDGLRPDAIATFNATTMLRLMREGSYTLAASTINPSKTLPSHTSMLTGEPPERHQVLWNNVTTAKQDEIGLPNIFSVARSRGYRTAAFFSKAKFQPLQRDGTLDYSQAPGGWFGRWSGERTVSDVEKYLRDAQPNLLFVHLTDPDAAGHKSGWMGEEYGAAVRAADSALSRLVQASDAAYGAGNYSLIVTADHGGHDTNHGSADPRDVTIPWIAWGRGVKPGALESNSVITMDTASTVLWLLGLEEPTDWAGTPLVDAFLSAAPPAESQ